MKNDYYGWVTLRQAIEEKWDDNTQCWHEWSPGNIATSTASLSTLHWCGGLDMVICRAMKPLPRSV